MRGFFQKILIFILFTSITTASSKVDFSEDKINKFDKRIEHAMEKLKAPGCSVVVVDKDKALYQKSFGKCRKNGKNIDAKTIFPISSLTKTVTAIIVGKLVDEGVINFDDQVRQYLPNFFIANEDISSKFTIRDLISHRSGFKNFLRNDLWSAGYSKDQIIESLRYVSNVDGFRKKYGYQNVVYGIIEDVIVKATGLSYDDLVEKYITIPMNLDATSTKPLIIQRSFIENFKYNRKNHGFWYAAKNPFNLEKSKNISSTHTTYYDEIIELPPNDFFQRIKATAGINMSADNLGEFLRMCLRNGAYDSKTTIISKDTFAELTSNQIELKNIKDDDCTFPKNRLTEIHYGMGFFNAKYSDEGKNDRRILFHMGGIYGVSNFFAISPSDNIAIGVLCNLGGTDRTLFSELICWEFFDIYFGYKSYDWTQLELDNNKKINEQKISYHKNISEKNPSPHENFELYTGTYNSVIYGDITVTINNDGELEISNGIRKTKISHVNGNIFGYEALSMGESFFDRKEYVVFYKGGGENFDSLYISQFHEDGTLFAKKI
ncbi:MAG: serine hydrolase [Holosporales bacterium]|jgi:CubicO group peptidase (beta-lactamase class C family)|nr:serine hydrolase [Holosporales bacterium]